MSLHVKWSTALLGTLLPLTRPGNVWVMVGLGCLRQGRPYDDIVTDRNGWM